MPKGYGYGLGAFSTPLAPFVDFYGHLNIPFLPLCENGRMHVELKTLTQVGVLAISVVGGETSRS